MVTKIELKIAVIKYVLTLYIAQNPYIALDTGYNELCISQNWSWAVHVNVLSYYRYSFCEKVLHHVKQQLNHLIHWLFDTIAAVQLHYAHSSADPYITNVILSLMEIFDEFD